MHTPEQPTYYLGSMVWCIMYSFSLFAYTCVGELDQAIINWHFLLYIIGSLRHRQHSCCVYIHRT